jgi:SAM-dependent methyltransferase
VSSTAAPETPTSPVPGDRLEPWLARVASTYAAGKTYEIHRGVPSGVGVTVPVPTPAELDDIYGAHYDYGAHALIEREKRWRSGKLADLLTRRQTATKPTTIERVLDVGCMHGYLLEELRRRGARVLHGIEIAEGPAQTAEQRGFVVHRGPIETFTGDGLGFDAIFAQHVLEHVRDPGSFLRHAFALLKPGGRLVVAVPHLGARSQRLFSASWGWYQVPVHLFHFSADALAALVQTAGFVVEERLTRGGDSLFVLMTLSHALRPRAPAGPVRVSAPEKAIIRAASLLLRPYLYLGDEELVVVASKPA